MEDLLKLAVNYGLGIFFAVGIAVAFFLYARDKDKQSYEREKTLMKFMEDHSLVTQKMIEENSRQQQTIASYQRQEHESISGNLALLRDSINSLNTNIINMKRSVI